MPKISQSCITLGNLQVSETLSLHTSPAGSCCFYDVDGHILAVYLAVIWSGSVCWTYCSSSDLHLCCSHFCLACWVTIQAHPSSNHCLAIVECIWGRWWSGRGKRSPRPWWRHSWSDSVSSLARPPFPHVPSNQMTFLLYLWNAGQMKCICSRWCHTFQRDIHHLHHSNLQEVCCLHKLLLQCKDWNCSILC